MAMVRHNEISSLFTNPGGIGVLANYGFFPSMEGNQVDPGEVRNLLAKLDELKPLHQSFKPLALAQFLGVPCDAVMNLFCKSAKGIDRYNVSISTYDAHKMLASFLTPKA